MKKHDTLNVGPSTILIRDQDLAEYKLHREKITEMQAINKIGDGSHIHSINNSKGIFAGM